MVQVYYPGGKFKNVYKYLPPKGQYRPFAYKYSYAQPSTLFDSWIIDYRPTLVVGALKEVRNYGEKSDGTFREVSSIIYDYELNINASPNDDMRYYKTSYTSATHRTPVLEKRPASTGSWNYDQGGAEGQDWGCKCPCVYSPCNCGNDQYHCIFDMGSCIYYGSVVLTGWTETKDGVPIYYSHPTTFDPLSGTDRLSGQSLTKTVSGGGLPAKRTQYTFNRASYFVGKNILKYVSEEKTLKNTGFLAYSLSTHTKNEFGGSAYGDCPHGTILQRKTSEKKLKKELNDGVAVGTITDADYIPQYTLTVFDEYGMKEEMKDAKGVYSINIFDHFPKGGSDNTQVFPNKAIANVKNAHFFESGVYTCDYDANPTTAYLDKSNGWERGQGNDAGLSAPEVTFVTTPIHYGTKCLKVMHAYGPSRNFRLFKDVNGRIRDYILSAWIKPSGVPVEKNMVMGADYRKKVPNTAWWPIELISGDVETPIPVSGKLMAVPKSEGWYYVRLSIPASKDLENVNWNDEWGVRLWVGAPNGPAGSYIYVDDIRFSPKDAIVNTNYYDAYRENVIAEVDNNNKAKYYTYDNFDRLKEIKNDNKAVIKSIEYHFSDELLPGDNIQVNDPNGGEKFTSGQMIPISWTNKDVGNISISYQNADGSGNQAIGTVSNQQGFGTYQWEIPAVAIGSRKIKVENTTQSYSDLSDAVFTIISRPPNIPSVPNPTSGQIGVDLNVNLTWTGGDPDGDAVNYDIYFGTDNPPGTKAGTTTNTSYSKTGLNFNTQYFWKIVSSDATSSIEGPIWTFTTKLNSPPNQPASPVPANGATSQPSTVNLQWTGGDPDGQVVTYSVYFGTVNPPTQLVTTTTSTSFERTSLSNSTYYYWKISASDGSLTTEGPVWNFLTINNPPSTPCSGTSSVNPATDNVTLNWQCGDDPDGDGVTYIIEVRNASDVLVHSGTSSTKSHTFILSGSGLHYWRVKARDEHGAESSWSAAWTFIKL